jgi:uncharacterized membrane protein YkvA (DUF1232 family)
MAVTRRVGLFRNMAAALRIMARPGSPGVGERISAVPRMVRATRAGEYTGITMGRLALLAAAVGYVLSPIDFLPEGLLTVFGLADDAMVISWIAATLVRETESFLDWERGPSPATDPGFGPGAGSRPGDGPADSGYVPGGPRSAGPIRDYGGHADYPGNTGSQGQTRRIVRGQVVD